MATVHTDQDTIVKKGAFVPLPAVGWIENNITLGGVTDAANEAVEIFTFEDDTIVLCTVLEVVTPTTNSITASIGTGAGSGSATGCMGEQDVSAAAGTKYLSDEEKTFVLVAASDALEIEVSGDAGAAGEVRVKCLIACAEDIDGS